MGQTSSLHITGYTAKLSMTDILSKLQRTISLPKLYIISQNTLTPNIQELRSYQHCAFLHGLWQILHQGQYDGAIPIEDIPCYSHTEPETGN